jgi:hypothetical protein
MRVVKTCSGIIENLFALFFPIGRIFSSKQLGFYVEFLLTDVVNIDAGVSEPGI